MKPYYLVLVVSTLVLACSGPMEKTKRVNIDSVQANTPVVNQKQDTAWHKDFLALQKVLADSDKKGLKEFISFPIMNAGNYIWHLVDVKRTMDIPADKVKPFTESDYEKHHTIIFGYNLPPAIQDINAEELFKEHFFRTKEFAAINGVKTLLEVKFDTYASRLTFRLITTGDEWQFTRFYHFNVIRGKISFQQLVLG